MTELEREILRQRAKLMRLDREGQAAIAKRHAQVLKRLNRELDGLLARIVEARQAGEEVRPSWLVREERYRKLLREMERETLAFLVESNDRIQDSKERATGLAGKDVPAMAAAALGPAPRHAVAEVIGSFDRLDRQALARIVRNAGDGTSLARLLAEIAPHAVDELRDVLAFGAATGRPVRQIARDVRKVINLPLARALTVCRNEILRAYREATTEMYKRSDIVRGWVWWAALDKRTCPICWAMHGSEHPAEEPMSSHVNCRCTQVPQTPSWAELGFRGIPDGRVGFASGSSRFATLTAEDQLAILGRSRMDLYNAGVITLEDLVRQTSSPRWGPGLRQANLAELGAPGRS